jgi:hypothetical protein
MRLSHILIFDILLLFGVFLSFCGCEKSAFTPENDLVEVPPPEKAPQEKDSIDVIDDIKFTISPYFWQDFMPTIPPGGPPFYLKFKIEIKNYTEKPIKGFSALMTTLYYLDTQEVVHNFWLIPSGNTQPEETILPGEEKILIYTNAREEIFSPKIEQGTELFGRILVKWNEVKHLLTSPPAGVVYTY